MDTVIKRISEIEQSAVAVMDDAAARKKAFAAEMEEKTRRFDQTADEETEKKAAESPTGDGNQDESGIVRAEGGSRKAACADGKKL